MMQVQGTQVQGRRGRAGVTGCAFSVSLVLTVAGAQSAPKPLQAAELSEPIKFIQLQGNTIPAVGDFTVTGNQVFNGSFLIGR